MTSSSDAKFEHMLRDMAHGKYSMSEVERTLVYRVMHATFNPLGVYYAVTAGLFGLRFAGLRRPLSYRINCSILCAMYGYEASWLLLDPCPTRSFVADMAILTGSRGGEDVEGSLINVFESGVRVGALQQTLRFIMLYHTRQSLAYHPGKLSYRERWLALMQDDWLPLAEMDFLTRLYWRVKLSMRHGRRRRPG